MTLPTGTKLSHYEITSQIGKGGMGEVYLADDTTLDRKVALKFLPEAFTSDPERMARFEREAKLLASLNHSNIAGIYGLEQADGNRFLVLEYVEGETLQARLSKGALPLEDALALCRQIAEGLEAAHEKGVIHRDLKPANVMITAEEKVKILDFGLAKALSDDTQSIDSSQSPTLTEAMTRPGVILGTAAYMSPEQAKGKSVDKRADIWAFGCILYECLTGKRAFEGETVTETLAAVIKEEPDINLVPSSAQLLVQKCLTKDRKSRLRDIGDAMTLLEALPETIPETKTVKRSWTTRSIAVLLLLALVVLSVLFSMREPSKFSGIMQLEISPILHLPPEHSFALSPDGRMLAFAAIGRDGIQRIYIRNIDNIEPKPLVGTESDYLPPFFWSPDSRFIVFNTDGKLKKIDVSTSSIRSICNVSGYAVGGSWNEDNLIIFGVWGENASIMSVSASGGTAVPVTSQESVHIYPTFLPDGVHFLYWDLTRVRLGSLNLKPEDQDDTILMTTPYMALYIPAEDSGLGHMLFIDDSDQTLKAQPFDDKGLKLVGEPVDIAEQVGTFMAFGYFSASMNGVLVYRNSGIQIQQLKWFDSEGNTLETIGDPGEHNGIALSPVKSQAAVSWTADLANVTGNIWLYDLVSGVRKPFTDGKGLNISPIYSPDGKYIVFASDREGHFKIYKKPLTGSGNEEQLLDLEEHNMPTSLSDDGRFLMYCGMGPDLTEGDLWVLPMEEDSTPRPFLRTPFFESYGCFSPDMRWVAYVSDRSGRNEIYIREFSESALGTATDKYGQKISLDGGIDPKWSKDVKTLYYRSLKGSVLAVDLNTEPELETGTTKTLFQAPLATSIFERRGGNSTWDITADGKKFLLETLPIERTEPPYKVILNWKSLLEK